MDQRKVYFEYTGDSEMQNITVYIETESVHGRGFPLSISLFASRCAGGYRTMRIHKECQLKK